MPLVVAMALSGLEREHWGDLKDFYDQGAMVVNCDFPSPPISTISDAPFTSLQISPPTPSGESGISSLSSDSDGFLENNLISPIPLESNINVYTFKQEHKSLIYWTGRNLLNLGDNVIRNPQFMNFAKIEEGVDGFFKNRALLCRLKNPMPVIIAKYKCPFCHYQFQK